MKFQRVVIWFVTAKLAQYGLLDRKIVIVAIDLSGGFNLLLAVIVHQAILIDLGTAGQRCFFKLERGSAFVTGDVQVAECKLQWRPCEAISTGSHRDASRRRR